ncbi:MAG: hypothetical protein A2Z47_00660 [Thermodesulfovibrio sp. RBG_19FT_COMBO_42_12]|nr:MAG: hypothetical protein A2Z47_00660 [Thermodesulfovibrio sp. RBG_19FT_COMBO_42_12]
MSYLISFILSIMLHITFLFGASGLEGFIFQGLSGGKVMYISLKEETLPKPAFAKEIAPPLLESFSEKRGVKEDAVPDENHYDNQKENKEELTSEEDHYSERAMDKVEISREATETKDKDDNVKEPVAEEGPFQIARSTREKLYFDIYWFGIYAGNAVLEAINDNGVLRISSQVHSAPLISVFYKVEDYAESVIMDGIPVNFKIKQHEGRHRGDKETIFDMNNKNVTFFNYLKGARKEHVITNGVVWDVMSGFYYLRTQPLEIGKAVYIDIFDSNKFFQAEINVLRKEKITIPNMGEVDTVIVKPELKSEGLFRSNGDILIWLTDDERRIPVKLETKTPVGSVVAKLSSLETEK